MKIPTDYQINAEMARAYDDEMASKYLRHTLIGDPYMDRVFEGLADMPQHEMARFIHAGMEQDREGMTGAPQALRDLFIDLPPADPPWLDYEEFGAGIRAFHRNSGLILSGFAAGVLVDGFTTYIAKSFVLTGRIADNGVRRLQQNNRHFLEIFFPRGLARDGDGWKLSLRIRLIHAQIRRLLNESGEWDTEAWGVPLSAAHMGYAAACFSARTIKHSESVGVSFTREERESIMAIWRYTGFIMGVPESILFTDEDEALRLHRVSTMCEPPMFDESIIMANALINSAPLVAGVTDPAERRAMVRNQVYPISRALIGHELADRLHFPRSRKVGILAQFKLLQRWRRWKAAILRQPIQADNFAAMLAISAFDEAGISYNMPDRVYAEESTRW